MWNLLELILEQTWLMLEQINRGYHIAAVTQRRYDLRDFAAKKICRVLR